jgi:hypothetical protein
LNMLEENISSWFFSFKEFLTWLIDLIYCV